MSFFNDVGQKAQALYKSTFKSIQTALLTPETSQVVDELFHLLEEYGKGITVPDLISGYLLLTSYYHYYHPFSKTYETVEDLETYAYYCKFANAIYGWKLIEAIINKSVGRVVTGLGTKITTGQESEILHNLESFESYTTFNRDIIVHAEWFSHHMKPAHLVALCHDRKSIVVAIRGTMDLHDALADVICNYDTIDSLIADAPPAKCHKGMKVCAENKYKDTITALEETVEKYPDYSVVVTGHSLGAGTAGILAYLYKLRHPQWNLQAYLFGCPPIFDIETAVYCRSFMTSFVNRDDIIPRLTFGSLYDLKAMIRACLDSNPRSSQRMWHVLTAGGNIPQSMTQKTKEFVEANHLDFESLKQHKVNEKIFLPGRAIYLHSPKEKTINDWYGEFAENSVFDEIVLSTHMFTDHMPDQYENNILLSIHKHTLEKDILFAEKPAEEAEGNPLAESGSPVQVVELKIKEETTVTQQVDLDPSV
uniref:sn-1-specific diacylglycerol lipase n=1 Tax=Arcella intermedia TaxID=1963864 RepID=A0A6B2L1W8_9EUKA